MQFLKYTLLLIYSKECRDNGQAKSNKGVDLFTSNLPMIQPEELANTTT